MQKGQCPQNATLSSVSVRQITAVHTESLVQSPKFNRVSLNETPEFPFWGHKICVDFDLRDSKKNGEYKQTKKIIFHYKNTDIHKNA